MRQEAAERQRPIVTTVVGYQMMKMMKTTRVVTPLDQGQA
jgi:hypothetical protein